MHRRTMLPHPGSKSGSTEVKPAAESLPANKLRVVNGRDMVRRGMREDGGESCGAIQSEVRRLGI